MFRTLFDIVLRNNLTGQIVDSVFADRQASAKIDPHKKSYEEGSQEITKAFYKLNRSVNAANRITDRIRKKLGEDFENEKKLTISDQIEVIKDHLLYDYGWLSEDLTRVIFAILLFLETMPHEAENDCCDDAYYYLLLPHLEEIISTIRLRSGFLAFPLWYFENLKKMFEIRLELGFGRHGKKDISAKDLSLLAKQNNLKSIQNAVSKKELLVIEGKGASQRIDSKSARIWLTSKIKNKLIDFSWVTHGPMLNERTKLNYLNYFKVNYFQIIRLNDFKYGWDDCPDVGVFQLIIIGPESKKNIYYGHAEGNLKKKFEIYFKKELKKAHGSSLYRKMELKSGVRFQDELNSGKPYTTLQFHLLTYEAKNYYFHHSSMLYLQLEKNLRKTVNYIDLNQTE